MGLVPVNLTQLAPK